MLERLWGHGEGAEGQWELCGRAHKQDSGLEWACGCSSILGRHYSMGVSGPWGGLSTLSPPPTGGGGVWGTLGLGQGSGLKAAAAWLAEMGVGAPGGVDGDFLYLEDLEAQGWLGWLSMRLPKMLSPAAESFIRCCPLCKGLCASFWRDLLFPPLSHTHTTVHKGQRD